ncbi:DNA sulfur modification protein DndD [Methylocaldum sp. BRCS4]|jgi:DNA sulfur modification protein DndD|nr:DNA sulfur modification protein DndD [Methylocaldum sp. BRCS4]
MILESIILENFGVYGGRQEANLIPERGKPIILFGGMNGGGKTTLLDAVQLAFYGSKARLSNRGRLPFKDYLRESIHRGADPGEGTGITLRFRRTIEGESRVFELQRYWREGVKGIEETLRVLLDGQLDDFFTEHWNETIEDYLPVRLAHLFFFDGEQIKELAEGGHAAGILGTAIHSLLGMDLVDRLESDLKVFERRKRAEGLDQEALAKLKQAEDELRQIDMEQEKAAIEEGALVNEAGRLAKELLAKEERFRAEGGELYLRRKVLDGELAVLKTKKTDEEAKFRDLVAGPLPLLMVENLLRAVEQQARHEIEVKRARVLRDALETRDGELLTALREQIEEKPLSRITEILERDRQGRIGLAQEPLILDADDGLAASVAHLRAVILPAAGEQTRGFVATLSFLDEKIARLEAEIDRIPTAERITLIQEELDAAREAHEAKLAELEAVKLRKQALEKQRQAALARLEKLSEHETEARVAEDDRQRMLKHSQRVRETLEKFRARVVRRHTASIEALMLESFRKLLRKSELVTGLNIDPKTFEPTLTGRDGKTLPFDRLSAGERQLLATSLLWGLARASGRPVPTIIDTPLGRLDSSHRRHLIERYFPCASHQMLLLSTDEEIVGPYFQALKPFITRTYLLEHNEILGLTEIKSGYFS